ncbi:uncharacterized protein Pyn_27882 [Prunus yedoensis var. nudiflora]|uniref:Uncharacterized protein n=1 Tax=Prunus yedoensis var. nudiflora TaxID=2094558 RepID=A0A314ZE53_PRUYE|nr:uncharacterized protein Pyn_27882 [Prunus yedoensis var. nudiflora]
MAKDLRYKDGAEFYGIVARIRKAVHIGCDDSLLGFMRIVPKRNNREQLQKLGDVHVQGFGDVNVQELEVGESSSFKDKDAIDLDFVQNDYAQFEDEEANTIDYTKDDIWLDGYVDNNIVDIDPNAEEDNDKDVTGEDEA